MLDSVRIPLLYPRRSPRTESQRVQRHGFVADKETLRRFNDGCGECLSQHQEDFRVWLSVIGWTATAVFSTSYFFKEATTLRRIQAAAALLWVLYGVAIHSAPVVVANVIVGVAAIITSLRVALNRRSGTDA